ncbi:Nif3-like dinuclear metal center hexameric protein [Chitinimonas sp. BJB300]|uniref:Nif3-like dinuclear metal center hexameric protein n=1 Tax=Chitinimonas sp. BJB300 TaxID=1559339 RepID=UPI000C0F5B37|nr:Nif3-like dinuclear metal center hexameric protein [Chitinimonas sp. BJB300]PHV11284.1 Nif3-like dinuclear metal center hexameric protein [Chitinimonas sp. BJB300]TSJ91555.1 Nif3-like dinuclear metal center hexameric protein [Chitinimonas sp. BJB300]
MLLRELENYTGQLLAADRFRDYAPNGVQVEGRAEVRRLLCGVTASEALIDAAIAWQADAILVHHGYFWKNEDARIVGMKKRRLTKLLRNDISLLAYHLPLDAHAELGNNAQLAVRLGLVGDGYAGEQGLIWLGVPDIPLTLGELAARAEHALQRKPVLLGDPNLRVNRLGWCTGGAQGYFDVAIAHGCDAYLTGEVSEQNYHAALEQGVGFLALGHHASERYGVQALASHLAGKFDLDWCYVDLDNPV